MRLFEGHQAQIESLDVKKPDVYIPDIDALSIEVAKIQELEALMMEVFKPNDLPQIDNTHNGIIDLPDVSDRSEEFHMEDGTVITLPIQYAGISEQMANHKDMADDNNHEADSNANENHEASNEQNDADQNELSEEEINEKQIAAIHEALKRLLRGEQLTSEELGNFGEMMMDQYYISQGYKPLNRHRVTDLKDKKTGFRTGIDGVYEKQNPDGSKSYVIADAKYNTSQLSETLDGKQMSDNWIDKRLDDAVGKEKADEIRDAAEDNPDSVSHEVYHIDPNVDESGNIHTDVQKVDSDGNKVGDRIIAEYYDQNGNRIQSQ